MLNLIKKDFFMTYKNISIFIMFGIFIPLLFFISDVLNSNMIFLYSVSGICFISTRANFSYDGAGKADLFIQSLPVTKGDIVVSKYISIFINFAIASIFTIIYMFVLDNATPLSINLSDLSFSILPSTLALVITYLSLSLPNEFAFTANVSNMITLVIYVMFLNMFIIGDNPTLKFMSMFKSHILPIVLGVTLLYFISMKLSLVIYKNRKFY